MTIRNQIHIGWFIVSEFLAALITWILLFELQKVSSMYPRTLEISVTLMPVLPGNFFWCLLFGY